jgi:hypothetical protein
MWRTSIVVLVVVRYLKIWFRKLDHHAILFFFTNKIAVNKTCSVVGWRFATLLKTKSPILHVDVAIKIYHIPHKAACAAMANDISVTP